MQFSAFPPSYKWSTVLAFCLRLLTIFSSLLSSSLSYSNLQTLIIHCFLRHCRSSTSEEGAKGALSFEFWGFVDGHFLMWLLEWLFIFIFFCIDFEGYPFGWNCFCVCNARWKVGFGWFDFTCSCCLVAEKVGKKRGDWNFGLLWVFFDLVSRRKLKSLLNDVN